MTLTSSDKWMVDPNIHLIKPSNFPEDCILVKYLISNNGVWDYIKLFASLNIGKYTLEIRIILDKT